MTKYLWQKKIDNYYAFWYTIKLDVTNEDFQRKILDFDYWFLLNGLKYDLFLFKNDHLIDEYLTRRKDFFFNRGRASRIFQLFVFASGQYESACHRA